MTLMMREVVNLILESFDIKKKSFLYFKFKPKVVISNITTNKKIYLVN